MKITNEQIKQARDEYLIIDKEELTLHTTINTQMDDNGKSETRIFYKKSDNSYWGITLHWCRYGYEDYGFELEMQDNELIKMVEEQKIITTFIKK